LITSLTALRRLTKLAWSILYGLIVDRPSSSLTGKAEWQKRQARRMLRALETKVTVTGTFPSVGLVVCNHLGYLDTIIIGAQAPLIFVAKSDTRNWPIMGLIIKSAGCILADRSRRTSAAETSQQMLHVMESDLPVVFFPEGTSSDGSSVLPFKPTLLQTALDTRKPITPAAISYQATSGDLKNDVCYWGEHTFATHLFRLAKIQNLTAHLTIGMAPPLPEDRKAAARALHAEVSVLLAPSK
jgi:1-acyl-sn-glycerol-3-phosphate acyltransferase